MADTKLSPRSCKRDSPAMRPTPRKPGFRHSTIPRTIIGFPFQGEAKVYRDLICYWKRYKLDSPMFR